MSSLAEIVALIPDLKYFGFKEFDDKFLQQMIAEAPSVHVHLSGNHKWDDCPIAMKYNEKQAAKNKRLLEKRRKDMQGAGTYFDAVNIDMDEQLSRERFYRNWKDDPAERARRIWRMWRIKILKLTPAAFPCWAKALRLIGLVQPSSAAVERVFSHLKRLVDILGHKCLESNIEVRMLLEANKKYLDNF
jgi:hypothetical protein